MLKKHREVYIINKVTENKYQLCKVLNEYDTNAAATDDLKKILMKKISENDLLKEYDKKEL